MRKKWSRHRGIPNTYNSQRFRSLVEARWASFFDELGWPWEYDPFELPGYIPDFLLRFPSPILVEVKSCSSIEELAEHEQKIQRATSGTEWEEREVLLVGCSVAVATLGSLIGGGRWFDQANFKQCTMCQLPTLCSAFQSYHCRRCGKNDSYGGNDNDLIREWRTASNRVQWRKP